MDLQFWKVEISFTREKNTDFNVELFDMKVCVETTIETSWNHDHSVVDRISNSSPIATEGNLVKIW